MGTPRHRTAPGCSYFVTTKCWEGRVIFQVMENAEILAQTMFDYRDSGAYSLHEFVIMPNHLHLLITPGETTSLEKAVQLIKGGSSHRIRTNRGKKMEVWQVGFYDWTIRDAHDWRVKVEYIRMNPVRARLVADPREWLYSSASQRFTIDPVPERFLDLASGAKARVAGDDDARGLKPPPPEGRNVAPIPQESRGINARGSSIGAKASTRSTATSSGEQIAGVKERKA